MSVPDTFWLTFVLPIPFAIELHVTVGKAIKEALQGWKDPNNSLKTHYRPSEQAIVGVLCESVTLHIGRDIVWEETDKARLQASLQAVVNEYVKVELRDEDAPPPVRR